ncbi:hypothetical protein T492DRAFT_1099575 [Pavlovales sp. CCMP2436]|nr:hypothetical protein T492DRAFT_1099575 [Pavlovales sp. CCMP2436]|mmetsp:Transcript_32867/g.81682  ORF Transcript_32867/g.81682 Transcript_32867/m.81682 type:complete len:235 (+) Transcript_32867:166-870(+)
MMIRRAKRSGAPVGDAPVMQAARRSLSYVGARLGLKAYLPAHVDLRYDCEYHHRAKEPHCRVPLAGAEHALGLELRVGGPLGFRSHARIDRTIDAVKRRLESALRRVTNSRCHTSHVHSVLRLDLPRALCKRSVEIDRLRGLCGLGRTRLGHTRAAFGGRRHDRGGRRQGGPNEPRATQNAGWCRDQGERGREEQGHQARHRGTEQSDPCPGAQPRVLLQPSVAGGRTRLPKGV